LSDDGGLRPRPCALDLKSELSANNPKIERKDYTRTVDPNVDALHQPGTNTWLLTWIEYVTKKNGRSRRRRCITASRHPSDSRIPTITSTSTSTRPV